MFGTRLKEIRKEKNLTQKQLAAILATSSGYISEIESGKKMPGGEFFLMLKRKLNININWLLTGEGDPYNDENQSAPSMNNPETSHNDQPVTREPEHDKTITVSDLLKLTAEVLASNRELKEDMRCLKVKIEQLEKKLEKHQHNEEPKRGTA